MVNLTRVVGKYANGRVVLLRQYSNGHTYACSYSIDYFKSLLKANHSAL